LSFLLSFFPGALPPNPRQDIGQASSLREDGFAAALLLAVLTPLDPISLSKQVLRGGFLEKQLYHIFFDKNRET